jgi:hypothetical protein
VVSDTFPSDVVETDDGEVGVERQGGRGSAVCKVRCSRSTEPVRKEVEGSWVATEEAMRSGDVVEPMRGTGWTAWNWNRSTWTSCLRGDERLSTTSAMIVRISPSVPGEVEMWISREEMTIRHTRTAESILQEGFHAENSYNTVGEIDLDCFRVSAIEIVLASMEGDIVALSEGSNDYTGPRWVIVAFKW